MEQIAALNEIEIDVDKLFHEKLPTKAFYLATTLVPSITLFTIEKIRFVGFVYLFLGTSLIE